MLSIFFCGLGGGGGAGNGGFTHFYPTQNGPNTNDCNRVTPKLQVVFAALSAIVLKSCRPKIQQSDLFQILSLSSGNEKGLTVKPV